MIKKKAQQKKWSKIVILMISLIVAFLLANLLVSFFTPKQLLKSDPYYMYRFNPGIIHKDFHADIGEVTVRNINAYGWYGDLSEYSFKKTKEKRILAIGDSFLGQASVGGYDNLFTEQIENNHKDVDVVTIGVGSYAFDNEYKVLEREFVNYNPDLVLIVTFMNDLMDVNRDHIFSIENDRLVDNTPIQFSALKKAIFFCIDTFSLCKLTVDSVSKIKGGLLINRIAKKAGVNDLDRDSELNYLMYALPEELFMGNLNQSSVIKAVKKSDLLLQKFKTFSQVNNVPIIFFMIPLREQVSDRKLSEFKDLYNITSDRFDIDFPYELIISLMEKNNPPYIDSLGTFREQDRNNSLYFEQDGHWSKKGHSLAYQLTEKKLKEIEFISFWV